MTRCECNRVSVLNFGMGWRVPAILRSPLVLLYIYILYIYIIYILYIYIIYIYNIYYIYTLYIIYILIIYMLIIYIIYNIYNIYFRQVGSLPNQEESVDSFRCFSEAQFQQRNASAHAKNFKLNMNVIIIFCVMLCMILCTTDIQPFMQGLHIMIIYSCMRY